jgi:hypothetical protein
MRAQRNEAGPCQFHEMIQSSLQHYERWLEDAFHRGADTDTYSHVIMRIGNKVVSRIMPDCTIPQDSDGTFNQIQSKPKEPVM